MAARRCDTCAGGVHELMTCCTAGLACALVLIMPLGAMARWLRRHRKTKKQWAPREGGPLLPVEIRHPASHRPGPNWAPPRQARRQCRASPLRGSYTTRRGAPLQCYPRIPLADHAIAARPSAGPGFSRRQGGASLPCGIEETCLGKGAYGAAPRKPSARKTVAVHMGERRCPKAPACRKRLRTQAPPPLPASRYVGLAGRRSAADRGAIMRPQAPAAVGPWPVPP